MSNTYFEIVKALSNVVKGDNSTAKKLSSALKTASMSMPDYDSMLPQELEVAPKVYTEKTQEQLLAEANNLVGERYKEQIDKINNSYQKKVDTLKNKEKNQNKLQKLEKVTDKYNLDTEKAKFEAIKNGIANSSIMGSYLEDLSIKYDEEVAKITNDYLAFQQNIDKEIALAMEAKNEALSVYDIKRAADLEKKVTELKKEQALIQQEINNYNRQLLIDRQNYQKDREKTLEELKKAWGK